MLAGDIRKMCRQRWVMETSMHKYHGGKHGSFVSKLVERYKKPKLKHPRVCSEAILEHEGTKPRVARFGGFSMAWQKIAFITDRIVSESDYSAKERSVDSRRIHVKCNVWFGERPHEKGRWSGCLVHAFTVLSDDERRLLIDYKTAAAHKLVLKNAEAVLLLFGHVAPGIVAEFVDHTSSMLKDWVRVRRSNAWLRCIPGMRET